MSNEMKMEKDNTSDGKRHQHRGKFTEGLLDNEQILKALNIRPGQTILDAGCGNGYMSKQFSNEVTQSGKVYALDPDQYFIKVLQNETQETNIETIVADITGPTQLNRSSVDHIYVSTVIHAFSQQQIQGFIQEVKRLLKPDGTLAIVEIEKKETPFGPPLQLRYSPEELKEIIPLAPTNTVKAGEHFYMQIFQMLHKKDGERLAITALAVRIVPWPGAAKILLFPLTLGILATGLAAMICITAGMAVTSCLFVFLSISVQKTFLVVVEGNDRAFITIYSLLALGGAFCITVVGVLLLLGSF